MSDKHPSLNTKILVAFLIIYVVWGSTYLAIKYAVETIPPFFMMGTRSLVAGMILYTWGRVRTGEHIRKEHLRSLIIIGAAFFLFGHGLLAWAEQRVSSGLAAILIASEPLWIVAMESLVIKSFHITRRGMIGIVMGFVGMLLLIVPSFGQTGGGDRVDLPGAIAVLLGTIAWSSGAVYSRVARLPSSPRLTAGAELIIGGLLLYSAGFLSGEHVALQAISFKSLFGLGYLIVFGSLIAFNSYVWLLGVAPVTRISTHTYVNPVIAVIIGGVIDSEPVTIPMIVAMAVIISSVYMVMSGRSFITRKAE
jgi:drug/metabolite transporter (DMT)-like permease